MNVEHNHAPPAPLDKRRITPPKAKERQASRKENDWESHMREDFEMLGKEMEAVAQAELLSLESRNRIIYMVRKQFQYLIEAEQLSRCVPSLSAGDPSTS